MRELAAREGLNPEGYRRLDTLDFKEAGVIGTAQTGALIAGLSRDGICMSVGLGRGLDHSDTAKFAFLLATPPIFAAGLLKIGDLTGHLGNGGVRQAALIAAIAAAITAIICVHYLTRYFKTRTLKPFAIYCLVFGAFMVVYCATVGAP